MPKSKKPTFNRDAPHEDVPIFNIESNWGKNKDAYFVSDSASDSDSGEEILVEQAIAQDKAHMSALTDESFRAFGGVKYQKTPISVPDSLGLLEERLNKEESAALKKKIREVLRDVTDVSKELQMEFGDSENERARKQMLYSFLTNACFYLYLVGSGQHITSHPALDYMEKIKFILQSDQSFSEEESEESHEQEQEEEEESHEQKHVPAHLQRVKDGEARPVTHAILSNKLVQPGKTEWRKSPRQTQKKKYARAMHEYRKTHKVKDAPRDGVYRGERSGIDSKKVKTTKLSAAH